MTTATVLLTSGTMAHVIAAREAFETIEAHVLSADEILIRDFHRPSTIFVDWLLPQMAGIGLVKQLRAHPASDRLHLTMVLARDTEGARERAIAAGADDYLIGPLTPQMLVEQIRRLNGSPATRPASERLRLGALLVDPDAFAASYEGRDLPLRVNEFNLLMHFARRPNRVFTRTELIGALGKHAAVGDERTVDVWVSRLRRSLTRHGIPTVPRTVRALGYVMDAPKD